MRVSSLALGLLSVLAFSSTCAADASAKPNKKAPPAELQIGVKYRPEDCPIRSKAGDKISVHYRGTLFSDGTEFDASYHGGPLEFTLGSGQVIQGWDKGLVDMCIGEKRKLKIPADLAYGARGAPPLIPANAALVFDTELMAINGKGAGHDEL